jgi:flagellar biosynthesis/type III secretory pathway protein FliH
MATVLKADHPMLRAHKPKPFNLQDLEVLAQQIVQGARDRARQILVEAQQEAETTLRRATEAGRKDGYEKGYVEGAEKGHDQALSQATEQFAQDQDQLVEMMQSVLTEFENQRNELLAGARDELVMLAVAIARRVTKRFSARNAQVSVDNLKEIIDRVGQRHVTQIEVSPADAEAMRRFAESLAVAEQRWQNVSIVAREEIERGGCRVQLPEGEIDAELDTQLDRIVAALLPGDQAT